MKGTIKCWFSYKNYGFIFTDDGDLFFHRNSWSSPQEPNEGDKVEFEIGDSPKGKCAISVKLVDE
jgi:CspA family cold shock protein